MRALRITSLFDSKQQQVAVIHGEGNGSPLQYSCLENPRDGGAWQSAVHGVAKSRTRLSDFIFTFHFSLSCIGEGNGNPLQCSCLENPRDGGAWWAVVYGVAQSWTRLKRLSSSSSVFPYKIFINSKEKKVTGLQWRNYLNPMIIVNITSKRHTDYIVLICCADKDTHHFCDFVAKNA